ncbi:MAG: carboxypeptidase-like regulatory domain-containing protein, partial [Candidatus Nezhaarchaeales archaeon]
VDITYESNQTKGVCFVGGWAYPVRVYIGGIVVYGEAVVLPDPAESQTITLYVNLYKSKARVLTYDGNNPIPSVAFKLGWVGVNVTAYNNATLISKDWTAYGPNFRNVEASEPYLIAYNYSAITDEAGEVYFWVPVWNISGLNYTTVIYGIYTIPGQTGGVPSTAPSVLIIHNDTACIGISGKLMNVSAAQDLGDIKAYAYNFYVKVIDYLERPLNNFTAFVNGSFVAGEFSDDVIAIQKTNSTGVASFISGAEGIFYFANYTYSVYAFQDPAIPYPQMVGEEPALNAGEWSHNYVVCLQFPGALIVKALDWEGDPLVGAKVELYWANGTWAGGLTAYAMTDDEGTAVIYMSNTWSIYTVEVWWRDSIVNQKYRLEEQLVFPEGVKVYSYAERMMVYSPKIMLVSDMGAALPAGITVEVVWPDGQTETYTTDGSGSIMMAQAPIGKYTVKAYWNDIKIYDSELWIESDVPVTLKTTVYEVELNFLTPRGAPLAGAEVQVVYPDGSTETLTLDSEGKAVLPLVAVDETHNTLTVQSVTWRDATIELADNTATIESSGPVTFYAANVYTLSVSVVGSQGQPLDGATVTVLKDGKPIATATAEGGVATVELPQGTYTVQASYLGKKGETSVTLTTDTTATVSLDVFIVIGNQAFSVGEVVLWIVIAIIIVLVLAAIIILMTRIGRRKTATLETS